LVMSRYPDFADYQRRTTREIPIVILTSRLRIPLSFRHMGRK
jgi:hypothetical protein